MTHAAIRPTAQRPLREHVFARCVFRVWSPDYCETVFPDGAIAPALFAYTPHMSATALALGYGSHVRRMHQHHDLAHTFLAEARGLPFSPVLRHAAHGTHVPDHQRAEEEALVMAFQAFLNDGRDRPELRHWPDPSQLGWMFMRLADEVWA